MTTEDDFQRMLDANPEDYQTRLVFADWLMERGDLRAEGYQCLGVNHMRPLHEGNTYTWFEYEQDRKVDPESDLPKDWYQLISLSHPNPYFEPAKAFETRREAEDAAATAFTELHAERRAQLLRGEAVVT